MRHTHDTDLIVVGSGIAGLFAALTAHDAGRNVVVVTKGRIDDSNTRYAQGGIAAAVADADSPQVHAEDTAGCGGELNDPAAVEILTTEARACIDQLTDLGVRFDHDGAGLALAREGGHSRSRVLHAGGDATGMAVQNSLQAALRSREVPVVERALVTNLLTGSGRVSGVELATSQGQAAMNAESVLLATGGAGHLFSRTTNPDVATGDGLALAYQAGAELMDLEFLQFHPTALAVPGRAPQLITEAARGEGGVLRDSRGRAFMVDHHPMGDLAPRDAVSRAMWTEIEREGADHLFLDMTHLSEERLRSRFPTLYRSCLDGGVNPSHNWVPVAPAAHYYMGGIRTDAHGRSSVPGLLAAGEAAATGVHGANRLASNSLLEGLVFGRRAAIAAAAAGVADGMPVAVSEGYGIVSITEGASRPRGDGLGHEASSAALDPRVRLDELQRRNWRDLGIVRTEAHLSQHLQFLLQLRRDLEGEAGVVGGGEPSLHGMALISELAAMAALMRTESRGAHFRSDFPEPSDAWHGHLVWSLAGRRFVPVGRPVAATAAA